MSIRRNKHSYCKYISTVQKNISVSEVNETKHQTCGQLRVTTQSVTLQQFAASATWQCWQLCKIWVPSLRWAWQSFSYDNMCKKSS